MRTTITSRFLKKIRSDGQLAHALKRISASPEKTYAPLTKMSTWELICEEVVDSEYKEEHYERVVAELLRRGITPAELEEMRVFAWETAGWLNYEKKLWDWTGMDEKDIRRAIDMQLESREIKSEEHARRIAYLEKYVSK